MPCGRLLTQRDTLQVDTPPRGSAGEGLYEKDTEKIIQGGGPVPLSGVPDSGNSQCGPAY